jgi:hypothetical protein
MLLATAPGFILAIIQLRRVLAIGCAGLAGACTWAATRDPARPRQTLLNQTMDSVSWACGLEPLVPGERGVIEMQSLPDLA